VYSLRAATSDAIFRQHFLLLCANMDLVVNLRTFIAVTRVGGFSEAARRLHVVPSVAAKRISQLEEALGTRLFERTTRKVQLTDAGQELLIRASAVMAGLDDLMTGLKRDRGRIQGHLRVMSPTSLTLWHLGDVLNAFHREHSDITLEISLVDRSISPLEEGFDLSITGHSATFNGVIDVPLAPVHNILCAAPSYLAREGTPQHPRELAERDCLVFKPSGSNWQFQSSRGAVSVVVHAKLTADDNQTLMHAAVSGGGIALLPRYIARQAVAAGTLQPILQQYPPEETWFKAYIPRARRELPRVKALVDWLVGHMKDFDRE
jgi:DNA-binding transcriptional LysR family regulator